MPGFEQALEGLAQKGRLLGVPVDQLVMSLLAEFCTRLAAYNKHTNLVSCAEPGHLVSEHLLDAWTLIPLLQPAPALANVSLVDIGSGAGFPGVILAIACPWLKVVLVESISKKAKFLSAVIEALNLGQQVQVVNNRAESLGHHGQWREKFSYATARAVGTIDVVAELTLPLIQVGGFLLAQKSSSQLQKEMLRAKKALPVLGGHLKTVKNLDEEVLGKSRVVMIVQKIAPTLPIYPRSTAKIKHHPLGGAIDT